MRRKFLSAAALALCVALLATGCQKKQEEDVEPVSTTPLAQGDLKNMITTTGTVASVNQVDVASAVSAPIAEVLVKVGDQVRAGDPLCTLDTTALQDKLADAGKRLGDAQTSYDLGVQRAQRHLQDQQNALAIAQQPENAVLTVLEARRAWQAEAAQAAANAEGAARAEASAEKQTLDAAQTALNDANNALAAAQNELNNTQAALDAAAAAGEDVTAQTAARDAAAAALANAQAAQANAQAGVDAANAAYAAKAAAESAAAYNACYEQTRTAPGPANYNGSDVTRTEAELMTAYNDAVAENASSVRGARLSIESAQDSLIDAQRATSAIDSIQLELKTLRDTLDKGVVSAPIGGVIVACKAAHGAMADTAGAMFSISDSSDFEMSGLLNEYDATRVSAGMEAEITTSATGEDVMPGTVLLVSPNATDDKGDFTVSVSIDAPASTLRAGMKGKLRVVLEKAENCFYVPLDSVGADADGNSVIYVYDEAAGTSSAVAVATGVATDYYVEVRGEDLEAGMPILDTPPLA